MTIARYTTFALAAGLAISTSAGAQDSRGAAGTREGQAAAGAQAAPGTQGQRAELPRAERNFIEQAAQNNHAELQSSRLALEKGSSAEVKRFAQHMVDAHTRTGNELATIARAKGVTPPDGPSVAQRAKLKMMSIADGEKFDTQYVQTMGVEAHRENIALFEKAQAEMQDADLKGFAARTLPHLREHLTMAEKLPQARR